MGLPNHTRHNMMEMLVVGSTLDLGSCFNEPPTCASNRMCFQYADPMAVQNWSLKIIQNQTHYLLMVGCCPLSVVLK